MHKTIIVVCMLVAAVAANAQIFLGGSLGLGNSKEKIEFDNSTEDGDKSFRFGIIPIGGFYFNPKMAAGIGFGYEMYKNTSPSEIPDGDDAIFKRSTTSIAPFFRYHFIEKNSFSVFGQAQFIYSSSKASNKVGPTTTDLPKEKFVGFYIMPAISYALTDNFILEANIGQIGYGSWTEDDEENELKTKDSGFDFDLGIDNIQFGAIYRF